MIRSHQAARCVGDTLVDLYLEVLVRVFVECPDVGFHDSSWSF
jgi:hypothetical protein